MDYLKAYSVAFKGYALKKLKKVNAERIIITKNQRICLQHIRHML